LKETVDNPKMIHGIFNWCDRWCERCDQTNHCTVYQMDSHHRSGNPDEFFKSLATIFDATMDLLKEHAKKTGVDFDALQDTDIEHDLEKKKYAIRNDAGLLLAKQYGKQVKKWMDSLLQKEPFGMEIRLQNPMLLDCMEVIQWYQYFVEVKTARALMSQKDEKEEGSNAYDSLGNAKAVLVAIKRNIGAWGYILQQF
jgi:hypothetical protein